MDLAKRIYQYLKPYKKRLLLGVFSMIVHSFLTIYFVRVFQGFLENIISDIADTEQGIAALTWICLGMILVYFLKGVAYYGQKYLVPYVAHKAIRDIRDDLYAHLQGLSLSFYNKNKTGEIISRVTNDVNKLQGAIVSGAISIVYKSLTFLGGVGYLFYLNYRLTFMLILIMPLMSYVISRFNKKIRKVSRRVQVKIANVSDVLQETLSAVRVVKSFGREDFEYERFADENNANFRAKVKNAQYSAVLTPSIEFMSSIAITSILWYGGVEVMRGNMTPSELIAFFTLLLTITSPLKSLTNLNSLIQDALAAAERIFATMDIENFAIDPDEEQKSCPEEVEGQVEFRNISFSYDKEGEVVLSDINFTAYPGEVIALVGASGAGKTTLVDLIPRFYHPTSGKILLDGQDIRQINLDCLRSHIGIVPQETILFSGSLHDNIIYGNLGADQDEVVQAAKMANAHNFITEFKDGYQTMVGERGVGLSGGQKQRIAIARAILKNPALLIFDEATSALDVESESRVQEALERVMEDRTTFIIAHRLTTIQNADKILVLDQGQILERGTHEQLLKNRNLYYDLYETQLKHPQPEGV
ncbi:MAG: ABC transporter ATP-binding protein [Bacillota bacterium]